MRTLVNDADRNQTVVENDDLRRYELLVGGITVGTLDYRALGARRALGIPRCERISGAVVSPRS